MQLLKQDDKVAGLGGVPLFESLSKKELRELARASEDVAVDAGTVLCREGRLAQEFFVIVDGVAEVTKDGKRLAALEAGDFFGEIGLITTTKRTATVTATTPVRCLILMRGEFRRVLDEHRSIEQKVMQALAERLLSYDADAAG